MKTVIACAFVLAAATAAAETKIIEYPDHYYAESTGTPAAKPVSSPDPAPPTASAPERAVSEKSMAPRAAVPVTNFDPSSKLVDPAQARTDISNEIERLKKERSELLSPPAVESSEQAGLRQNRAAGLLRKINKLSSELLKRPQP